MRFCTVTAVVSNQHDVYLDFLQGDIYSDSHRNGTVQKPTLPPGMSVYSSSPVNNEELVAPIVNVPPTSTDCASETFVKRVSWKAMSGSSSVPGLSTRDCQKGVLPDAAMFWKARPKRPETGSSRRPFVTFETMPARDVRPNDSEAWY